MERESPALLRMAEDGVCSRGLHLLVEDQCPLCSLFLGKLAIKIRVRHDAPHSTNHNQVGTQFLETEFSGEQRLLVRPIEKCSSRVG